jgi:cationic peptide transport system substrate-binding protein
MPRLMKDYCANYSYLTLLIALLAITGCEGVKEKAFYQSGIIYCSEGSPATFNPQLTASGTTIDATSHQIYDRLLDFDPVTGQVVAGLASSWLVSDDGLTYTFQLRKDVSFHQTEYFSPGRDFNADDVMFSINRWRLPDHPYHNVSGGSYPYFDSLQLSKVISDVRRINGYRVQIILSSPDSSFLANLATDFAVILSAEYAEQLALQGEKELIDNHPIGTGPYKFVNYHKDRYIRYQKHQQYWKSNNAPNRLIFDITPSSSLRLAKLITGECDAISLPAHAEQTIIRQRDDLMLDVKPGLNVGFWAFNTTKAPFDNADVRKALVMAIDKNALLEAIYYDSAQPAHGIVPPTSWAYQSATRDSNYNPVLSRRLLADNGIEPGFSMNIWAMPVERAYNPDARKMAEMMQNYLLQVGVEANIVSYEWSTFRQRLKLGLHDSVLIGWSADNGDPDNFYRPLLSCSAISSGTNRARWCSAEYDELINQALKYTDVERRATFYHKANQLLATEMPLMPIAHAFRYQAYRNNISGLSINPYGGIRFDETEKN